MIPLVMHGSGKANPAAYVKRLKGAGFTAFVDVEPTAALIAAAAAEDLSLYACVGAFWLKTDSNDPTHYCLDARGEKRSWFASGCPNDPALRNARLEEVARWAGTPGIAGILLDGGRYASLASQEGVDSFFTCFCPNCQREMEALGYDPSALRCAALSASATGDILSPALHDFYAFRQASMDAYYRQYRSVVKSANPDAHAGAYIFADSLAGFTGQRAQSIGELDIVAPMIYRHYPETNGPATLNHEWAAALNLLTGKSLLPFDQAKSIVADRCGVRIDARDAEGLLADGFPPGTIEGETRRTKERFPAARIWPIIELNDELLPESTRAAARGGADAVSFFAWSENSEYRLDAISRAIDK